MELSLYVGLDIVSLFGEEKATFSSEVTYKFVVDGTSRSFLAT